MHLAAVCRALAEHGARVVISDVRAEDAGKLAESIRSDDLAADAIAVDASDESSIIDCCRQIVEKHGQLDGCVNMTFRYTKTAWEQIGLKARPVAPPVEEIPASSARPSMSYGKV